MIRHVLISAVVILNFVSVRAQTAYYDALQLRNTIRWEYKWKFTIVQPDANGVMDSTPNNTKVLYEIAPYPEGFKKEDTLVGSAKWVYVSYGTPVLVFEKADDVANIVKAILRSYYKDPSEQSFPTISNDYQKNNQFIGPILAVSGYDAGGGVNILSNILGGVGNLDVTAFADGLAKFLVERTKQELDEAFFRKFADFLNRFPEFRTLFPNTNTLVNNFNSWEFSNLLNTLKEAFDKDIKELLANFIKLKDLNKSDCKEIDSTKPCNESWCSECMDRMDQIGKFFRNTNEGIFLLSGAQIANGILQSQKVPDIIHSVSTPDFLLGYKNPSNLPLQGNFFNSLQLMDILSLSLKSQDATRSYISKDQFSSLLMDSVLRNLFFGLIYQQIANANNQDGIVINAVPITRILTPGNIDGIKKYLDNILTGYGDLQKAFDNLHEDKINLKADLSADYGLIFESFRQYLQVAASIQIINPTLQFPNEMGTVLNETEKALQIAHDISVRNYNAAVVGTLTFVADAAKQYLNSYPHLQEFTAGFLKYGSFAANVVLSENSDDVKQAIESFALPSGSSTLKKHTQFSISLNAYVGFVYGPVNPQNSVYTKADASGALDTTALRGGNSFAIYAPVGVSFNWGLGWKKKNPWSLSAFISLIDVGAIVGYRFGTDTGQLSNTFKVNLSNILAPGGNIILGLPNMPISLGGGLQWIPTLQRDAKSNSFYNLDHSGFRYQVFITVDLPLLNFHTSAKSLMYVKKIN